MNLFDIVVSEDKLHQNFVMVSQDKDLVKVLNTWSIGFIDRDNKFVKEFQTTFNTAFWELYLHSCFRNLGFMIDYSFPSPDFLVKTRKNKEDIIIEAVTTSSPVEGTPEHHRERELEKQMASGKDIGEYHSEIIHLATERIANSISNKAKKYLDSYSKLTHVTGKPFILAVGAFEQPFFYLQGTGAIQRVLYGITAAEYKNDIPYFEYADNIIKKKNGKEIPIGLFNNSDLSFISAIIFSPVATIGKVRALSTNKRKDIIFQTYTYNDYDTKGSINVIEHKKYKESLFDGMSLYINPYAENPIDPKDFDNNDINIVYNKDLANLKHGFLFSRTVTRLDSFE